MLTRVFAITDAMLPADPRMRSLFRLLTLERGLLAGALSALLGCSLLLGAVLQWHAVNFGALDVRHTMRWAIPGMMFAAIGVQTVFASFFFSILGTRRR